MSKPPYIYNTKGDVFRAAALNIAQAQMLNQEGAWMAHFIERWGLVASVPDGEDSAGRQKLRLPTPDELVTRAADIAAATWAECEKRGWLIELPAPDNASNKSTEA